MAHPAYRQVGDRPHGQGRGAAVPALLPRSVPRWSSRFQARQPPTGAAPRHWCRRLAAWPHSTDRWCTRLCTVRVPEASMLLRQSSLRLVSFSLGGLDAYRVGDSAAETTAGASTLRSTALRDHLRRRGRLPPPRTRLTPIYGWHPAQLRHRRELQLAGCGQVLAGRDQESVRAWSSAGRPSRR
jgi:hypothetical protein